MSFFKKILKKVNQTLDKPIHHVQHKRILKRVERMKQIIKRLEEVDTKKIKLGAFSDIYCRHYLHV